MFSIIIDFFIVPAQKNIGDKFCVEAGLFFNVCIRDPAHENALC
jgi:hypothetical protein